MESPWLIHTGCSFSMTAEKAVLSRDRDCRRAVLALLGRHNAAAQVVGHQLDAVADAQQRDVASTSQMEGSGWGAPSS